MKPPSHLHLERFATDKAMPLPRFLILVFALFFLPGICPGRVEIFVRPVVQYTQLPGSSRTADGSPTSQHDDTPYFGPEIRTDHYTTEASSLGGGLSLGVALGRELQFEIGAECTLTRFNGSYTATVIPAMSFFNPVVTSPDPGPSTVHPCSYTVMTFLASYRQFLGKRAHRVRPYFGCGIGFIGATISPAERQAGGHYVDHMEGGSHLALSMGVGFTVRLGHKTYIETGYRFMCTEDIFSHSGLYRQSHNLNLALNQRF